MKFLLCGTVLLAFFAITIYGQAYIGTFADPKYPGKCVIEGYILSPGQKFQPKGTCQQLECINADGRGGSTGCGLIGAPPNCRLADFDFSKPHPRCCHRELICD
ncbi:uncharacterized protein LOC119672906 [Teleopsis dalmanni]|uniref:uncharacterized protein LOC119672906 n=1 Tax=Teleopsis dalmanni TaxID=139649 RepID=UPI0018CD70EB|nr:uncharacterized protein LOC119672906 [Teleopsis dalmanni]